MSLPKNYITKFKSLKVEDRTWDNWDNVNIRLLNEKLMHKEKGESSQTVETTLQAQKHSKSKRNTSKDICNYNKQACHRARNCKKKQYDAMHK
jgi:hypothetical protein